MDGFISCVWRLLAAGLHRCKDYMIASHVSKEPARICCLQSLEKKPSCTAICVWARNRRHHAFPILDQANAVYRGMATFDEAQIETYVPLT